MMGAGAPTPGYSAHDQAITMLKVASDAKGTKDRLEALHKATQKHDDAKRLAQEKIELQDQYARAQDKREAALDERETTLKEREETHTRNAKEAAIRQQARADSLVERERAIDQAKGDLAQKINDFSRHSERQIAAIEAKHQNVDKLLKSIDSDRKDVAAERAQLGERIQVFEKILADILGAVAALKR